MKFSSIFQGLGTYNANGNNYSADVMKAAVKDFNNLKGFPKPVFLKTPGKPLNKDYIAGYVEDIELDNHSDDVHIHMFIDEDQVAGKQAIEFMERGIIFQLIPEASVLATGEIIVTHVSIDPCNDGIWLKAD